MIIVVCYVMVKNMRNSIIVSSNIYIRNLLRKHLSQIGIRTAEADRGFSAMCKINETDFDFIFLDKETHDNASLGVAHFVVSTNKQSKLILITMSNDIKYMIDAQIRIDDKTVIAPFTFDKILEVVS